MRFTHSRFLFCKPVSLAFLISVTAGMTAQADVLYRETFGTDVTGGQGASSGYDWAIDIGSTALDKSASTDTTAAINRTANASKPNSATETIGQVNAGSVVGATPAAYGAGIPFVTQASGNAIFWTSEFATTSGTGLGINPSSYSSLSFSWNQGNGAVDSSFRLALKINGQWYASQQQFFNTAAVTSAANFATGAELKTFNFAATASSWSLLSFDGTYDVGTHTGTSGTVLALGSQASSDLSGNIDAFGLFSDAAGTTGNRRFDSFEIDIIPIPEPSSLALLSLAGLGALAFKRRRS
jgi:hypothetical protein